MMATCVGVVEVEHTTESQKQADFILVGFYSIDVGLDKGNGLPSKDPANIDVLLPDGFTVLHLLADARVEAVPTNSVADHNVIYWMCCVISL
jgi:hypothetical protein